MTGKESGHIDHEAAQAVPAVALMLIVTMWIVKVVVTAAMF